MALRLGHSFRPRDLRLETLEDRCTPSVAGLTAPALLTPVLQTADTAVAAVETATTAVVQQAVTAVTAPLASTTGTVTGLTPAVNQVASAGTGTVLTASAPV